MEEHEKFVFNSYLHSQGNLGIQASMIAWFAENSEYSRAKLINTVEDINRRVMKYRDANAHVSVSRGNSADTKFGFLKYLIYEPIPTPNLSELSEYILERDLRFMLPPKRPNRPEYHGRTSPSHYILYSMLGLTTRDENFDRMYRDMHDDTLNSRFTSHRLVRASVAHCRLNPSDTEIVYEYLQLCPDSVII